MNTIEELLQPGEAAKILGVKRNTLSVWRLRGFGPKFIRVGRCVRYKRESISKWIDSREATSTQVK